MNSLKKSGFVNQINIDVEVALDFVLKFQSLKCDFLIPFYLSELDMELSLLYCEQLKQEIIYRPF